MNTLVRKLLRPPKRLVSVLHEVAYVGGGLLRSGREVLVLLRRLKNTRVQAMPRHGVAVFNAARSFPVADIELYLGYILALNGLTVYVLFDDGLLEHWDSGQVHDLKYYSPYHARWFIKWRLRIRKGLIGLVYRSKGVKTLNYSKLLEGATITETPDEHDMSDAISSTKRFFETGVLDLEKAHKDYYSKCLRNSMVSKAVARRALEELQPDLFVTSHCIYSVWGPAYRVMKAAGVPVMVYDVPGATTGKIRLADQYVQTLWKSTDWREFDAQTPLTAACVKEGGALLEARANHAAYDVREYFTEGRSQDGLSNLSFGAHGVTFGMFPNVVWDGDIRERNVVFNNIVEWAVCTIQTIRTTNHHLCIRFHPSEATRMDGSVKLVDILREKIPDLDSIKNVTLIPSTDKVDSYALARKHIDVGLIYDGTLCMELTYLGIPVIACTNGVYTLDSFVYKPKFVNEYVQYLRDPAPVTERYAKEKETRRANACKYAYWYFKGSTIDFKPLEKPYPAIINYGLVSKNEPLSAEDQRISDRLMRPLRERLKLAGTR